MRRLTPFLVLILTLAFASDAGAKEIVAAKVCGPSKCTETRDRDQLTLFTEGGAPTDPPAKGGAWYSVKVTMDVEEGRHEGFEVTVLPGAGLMRTGDPEGGYSWYHLTPASARGYKALVGDIAPYPASKLGDVAPPKVRVDEVIMPPRDASGSTSGGGASPLPWIGAALVLLIAAGTLLMLRRRGRRLPWARPSEG